MTLDGVQPPNTKITRSPDAANFQSEASTDEFKDEKFSKSYMLALVSCIWYMKTVKLCIHNLFHTEHKAEKDLDKKSR